MNVAPNNHLARIVAVTALVVVALLVALIVIDGRASDATASTQETPALIDAAVATAGECPEATALFEELGLEAPDTYTPDCPAKLRQLRRELTEAIEHAPPAQRPR